MRKTKLSYTRNTEYTLPITQRHVKNIYKNTGQTLKIKHAAGLFIELESSTTRRWIDYIITKHGIGTANYTWQSGMVSLLRNIGRYLSATIINVQFAKILSLQREGCSRLTTIIKREKFVDCFAGTAIKHSVSYGMIYYFLKRLDTI